jgi:hypothetical protein
MSILYYESTYLILKIIADETILIICKFRVFHIVLIFIFINQNINNIFTIKFYNGER